MEWIALSILIVLLFAGITGEVIWLVRKGLANKAQALAYVLTADLVGLGLGGLVISVVLLLVFMMVMGPAGRGSSAPESAYWAAISTAILLPLMLLVLSKRIFLAIMKIGHGDRPWTYSVVSSIFLVATVLVPPLVLYYFMNALWK